MYVSDILTEAKDIIGQCSDSVLFRRISDAVRLANAQSAGNDWNIAVMDLCVCDGCVTLPADVGTVLSVNNGGFPTLMRDQWFQYHANGAGIDCCVPFGYTDELGQVSTYRDPDQAVKLVAVVNNALDSGCTIRVFGWDDDGKRIYTTGAGGILEDGFLVPTVYGFSVASTEAPAVARIDRVQKSVTNGFVQLIAIDPNTSLSLNQIGYYLPWETNPTYRRIKVPDRSWLRIKYRRKDIEVRSSVDWINFDNREALFLLLKAIKFRLNDQIDTARSYETEGMRLLSNDAASLKPPGINPPQVIFSEGIDGQSEGLLY